MGREKGTGQRVKRRGTLKEILEANKENQFVPAII